MDADAQFPCLAGIPLNQPEFHDISCEFCNLRQRCYLLTAHGRE